MTSATRCYLMCAALLGVAVAVGGTATTLDVEPRPFDPPSDAEAAQAVQAAGQALDGQMGRHVPLGTALATEKQQPWVRLFDVWFYDYDRDETLWVIYDPASKEIMEHVDIRERLYLPLATAEVVRARELALASGVVPTAAAELPLSAMLLTGEGTACHANRCAVIGFGPGGSSHLALVNLSTDEFVKGLSTVQEAYLP